ncbi:hypothetical protein ACLB1E_21520 [Escherichia coli]
MSRKTVTTRLLTGRLVANGDVSVELRDADQQAVATGQGTSGTLQVVNPHSGNRVKVISMNCASQPKARQV